MPADTTTVLDVRDLAPKDRHTTIFDHLRRAEIGETVRLINDHDPVPLRYQLDAEYPEHYVWEGVEAGPDRWVVDITSRARVVDARPMIAAGEEPFQMIMEAAATVGDDEMLVVYAPFDPVPLQGVLAEDGFDYVVDQLDDENWRVRFSRV